MNVDILVKVTTILVKIMTILVKIMTILVKITTILLKMMTFNHQNNIKMTFSTDVRDQHSNIDHERTSGKGSLA